jgi:hypothetical protein
MDKNPLKKAEPKMPEGGKTLSFFSGKILQGAKDDKG